MELIFEQIRAGGETDCYIGANGLVYSNTHDGAREGETRRSRAAAKGNRPRQPEIEQLHAVRREEDVRGFQIAMYKTPAM
jgi:hypothetical protein